MPDRPTGPEDPTPGPELGLTADQAEELCSMLGARRPYRKDSLLHRRKGSVRLRDLGAVYVEAQILDPDGEVIRKQRLPPIALRISPAAFRRALREQSQED